jgi:4-amino-4-deoxy-L-arabinose transferase-like glycosyltransferase
MEVLISKGVKDCNLVQAGENPGVGFRPLIWIFGAGAILRLVLWLALRDQPLNIWDEQEYDQLARTLAATGDYAFTPGGELTSLRPPLYPALVAGIYWITGLGNFAAVRLLQAALSLGTAGLLFALGRSIISQKAAFWLTALFCFYPSFLGFNNLLLTETLFTLLLTAACYFSIRTLSNGSATWALAAGVALGLAALTRSIVWLVPPLVAAYFLWTLKVTWSRRMCAAAALIAGFVVVVAPWAARNTHLQRTFVVIDVMGGRNFMMGNYQYTPFYRAWDAISITGAQSWDREVFATYPREQWDTQGNIDKLAFRRGAAFVMANPGLTLQRDVVKFFDFWGLERELVAGAGRGFFGVLPKVLIVALAAVICGAYAAVLFLGIFGAVMAPPADRRVTWLLLCIIAYICFLHTITFGHSRYHLPVMPLVMVFAAGALVQLKSIWDRRRQPGFLFAAGLCVLFVASWAWMFLAVDRNLLATALTA